jgi:V/A-type H+-transporting ATPase subunit C
MRENSFINADRMDQMVSAASDEEAMKIAQECGYSEVESVNVDTVNEVLSKERDKLFQDLSSVPNPEIMDLFKIKYDYHNAKVLLKSEVMGVEPDRLMVDLGRVPVKTMENAVRTSDFKGMPSLLQDSIVEARDVLGTTQDPQLSDFVLDRAYFQDMYQVAQKVNSEFMKGYVRITIDVANLRSIVRSLRMKKGTEFLSGVLFEGGEVSTKRILGAVAAGTSLEEIYSGEAMKAAASAGNVAVNGGSLTKFEKLCDDAVTAYLKKSKHVSFSEAPVVAYLAAKDTEMTAVRIIMTGRLAGLPADVIRERLREAYV